MSFLTSALILSATATLLSIVPYAFLHKNYQKKGKIINKSLIFLTFAAFAVFSVLFFKETFKEVDQNLGIAAALTLDFALASVLCSFLLPRPKFLPYIAMPLFLILIVAFIIMMLFLSKKIIQPDAFLESSSSV